MSNLQKGFAPLIILLIIAAIGIGGGAYYISQTDKKIETIDETDTPQPVLRDRTKDTSESKEHVNVAASTSVPVNIPKKVNPEVAISSEEIKPKSSTFYNCGSTTISEEEFEEDDTSIIAANPVLKCLGKKIAGSCSPGEAKITITNEFFWEVSTFKDKSNECAMRLNVISGGKSKACSQASIYMLYRGATDNDDRNAMQKAFTSQPGLTTIEVLIYLLFTGAHDESSTLLCTF